MKSEEISQDVQALESDLEALRARVEKDSSSFATLEQEVAHLRENLLRTRESVAEHEARLADKQKELAEAQRLESLEAYEDDVHTHHEAADRAVAAATGLLAALDAYDDETMKLRQLVEQMRSAFGSDDERIAEVESALGDESARLRATSEAVLAATKWRLDVVVEETSEPEAEAEEAEPEEELSQDLQEIAQERRRARIKEYFGKG